MKRYDVYVHAFDGLVADESPHGDWVKHSEAEARIKELEEALNWFCVRVEMGQIKSKNTYERFKELLEK